MKVTGPTLLVVSIGGAGVDTARVMCDRVSGVCVCVCVNRGDTERRECRVEEEDVEEEQVNNDA